VDSVSIVVAALAAGIVIWLNWATREPVDVWHRWWAWYPVWVAGQRQVFRHVMRCKSHNTWAYRDLSGAEHQQLDDDRADYQTW